VTASIVNRGVICDWLDVTYAPSSPVVGSIAEFLSVNGGTCSYSDDQSSTYRLGGGAGGGTLKVDTRGLFTRVSASGGVLAHFRAQGVYFDYLSTLSEFPHNVSRLDAALDVAVDASPVIAKLRRRYVSGACPLGRKSLPVKSILSVRLDGAETGTFYVGHRSQARQTARVYDKAHEAYENRGELMPPTTRYEVTARGEKGRSGPSLRDAAEPERLFWHIASPALLKRPDGVPAWDSQWGGGWCYEKPEKLLPAEVLKRAVSDNAEIAALVLLADKAGEGGRTYLMTLLRKAVFAGSTIGAPSAG
jgi:hypothetical protein